MEIAADTDIVIVGGGICGLATALALHRKGIRSVVLERSEKLRATGAAIIVQTNGWRALEQLGVGSTLKQTAIQIQGGKYIFLGEGEPMEIPFGVPKEFRCLKRKDLIKVMANRLPAGTVRTRCQVVSIELDPVTQYPQLLLTSGSILKAKVVIGCDGVNSIISNTVGLHPSRLLLFSTCVARGFTNYPNAHTFPSEFTMLGRGEVQLGIIPVTDKLVYWFVTRIRTSQDSMIWRDPVLIRQSMMETMKGFPAYAMEMISNCKLKSLHFTHLKYVPPWEILLHKFRKGTVTIAGDAMHATGPFIAQGGSASLEDAVVLARCLAHKLHAKQTIQRNIVEEAFAQYLKERRMRVFWLLLQTFLIGKKLDAQSSIVKSILQLIMDILFKDQDAHSYYDCGLL